MSDFAFKIIADGSQANKAVDDLTDGLDDIKRKAGDASRGTQAAFTGLEKSVESSTSAFGKFKAGVKSIGETFGPFNQALELGGKVVRLMGEGLDAYAKTSPAAAREVEKLTSSFNSLKQSVSAAAGAVAVFTLKALPSVTDVGKIADLVDRGMTLENALKSVQEANERAAKGNTIDRLLGGFKDALKGSVDYWNTDGQTFIDSFVGGMEKSAAATKKVTAEVKKLAQPEGRNILDVIQTKSVAGRIGAPTDYTAGLSTGTMDAKVSLWIDSAASKTAAWNDELEKNRKLQESLASGVASVASEFVNMAAQGELSIERLGNSIAKLILQMAALRFGGPWGQAFGQFIGSLPAFATGGQFMVGGSGGTDSQLVAFRASPNERVTIDKPDSTPAVGGFASMNFVVQNDPREVVAGMNTGPGESEYRRLNRKFRRHRG